MKKFNYKKLAFKKDHGAAMMIFAIFVFFLSMTIIVGISRPAIREFSLTKNTLDSKQAYFLAESGVEDAFYRVKTGRNVDASESLVLGSTTATTTITDLGSGNKQIESLADKNTYKRKVNMNFNSSSGTVVPLSYTSGIHAGTSGILWYSDASYGDVIFTGDAYSQGPMKLYGTARITGSLTSGGSSGSIAYDSPWNRLLGYFVSGNSSAHTVDDTTTTGTIYCQSGTNNNKSCNTTQPDPTVANIPDLSTQITAWKAEAAAGNVYSYDSVTDTYTVGPKKFTGDFTMYKNMKITGPIWVTGHLNIIQTGKKVSLASSFGSGDGVIISDDDMMIGAPVGQPAVIFEGSGASDSNILMITTKNDVIGAAASVFNVTGNVLFYAQNGKIWLTGTDTNIMGAIGKKIQLGGSTNTNVEYVVGPSSLNIGPDTYTINSWKEAN
jgi:Tfp pilus assembly protein PilX